MNFSLPEKGAREKGVQDLNSNTAEEGGGGEDFRKKDSLKFIYMLKRSEPGQTWEQHTYNTSSLLAGSCKYIRSPSLRSEFCARILGRISLCVQKMSRCAFLWKIFVGQLCLTKKMLLQNYYILTTSFEISNRL